VKKLAKFKTTNSAIPKTNYPPDTVMFYSSQLHEGLRLPCRAVAVACALLRENHRAASAATGHPAPLRGPDSAAEARAEHDGAAEVAWHPRSAGTT